MADAPEKIWAFHDGPMVGLFIGKKETGTNVSEYVRADIAERQIAELRAERARQGEVEHHLSNLLARIHRDGGHYEADHGTAKAAGDADTIVANLYAAEAENARLRALPLKDEDEISPYEWLAQEFDRLAILRKMWTADEVAATIRRHDIERSTQPLPLKDKVERVLEQIADGMEVTLHTGEKAWVDRDDAGEMARSLLSRLRAGGQKGWRSECATEGCNKPATVHFERGGIGSYYCHECYMRIQALPAAPSEQGGDRS